MSQDEAESNPQVWKDEEEKETEEDDDDEKGGGYQIPHASAFHTTSNRRLSEEERASLLENARKCLSGAGKIHSDNSMNSSRYNDIQDESSYNNLPVMLAATKQQSQRKSNKRGSKKNSNSSRRVLPPRRKSSLELRRELPAHVDVFLKVETFLSDLATKEAVLRTGAINIVKQQEELQTGFMKRTCFRSTFSLRKQIMLSFGIVNSLTILFVMTIGILGCMKAGNNVNSISSAAFTELAKEIQGNRNRYAAEEIAHKLIPTDLVQILYEAVQDRFIGYPNHPGYDDDKLVPFFDIQSKSNIYPVHTDFAPFDWQIQPNVNRQNYEEHVQDRWDWYTNNPLEDPQVSTSTGSYYMQGMCDPEMTDPLSRTYYPNCTMENNNIQTGGVIAPTPTNYQIHRKVSDLTPLFKSLYEFHQEVRSLGIYFMNGGSGSTYQFPHHTVDTNLFYESSGCDWLLRSPHPYNLSRPIIDDDETRSQIQYNTICRPKGVQVSARNYNPLEFEWCKDQALHPDSIRVSGPYKDIFYNNLESMIVGRAIYDTLTDEFIGCIGINIVSDAIDELLKMSERKSNATLTVVRYDEAGTVVASPHWEMATSTDTTTIDKIDVGISKTIYDKLYALINFTNYTVDNWNNGDTIRQLYDRTVVYDTETKHHISCYPIPSIPETYDHMYKPDFLVLTAVPADDIFFKLDMMTEMVKNLTYDLVIITVLVGCIGTIIVNAILGLISHMLTSPLQHMNEVAKDIFDVNFGKDHADECKKNIFDDVESAFLSLKENLKKSTLFRNSSITSDSGVEESGVFSNECGDGEGNNNNSQQQQQQQQQSQYSYKEYKPTKCTPKTEINEVEKQFEKMVSNFTGRTMAKSIKANYREMRNEFHMVKEFETLYKSRSSNSDNKNDDNIDNEKKKGKRESFLYNYNLPSSPHSTPSNALCVTNNTKRRQFRHTGINSKDYEGDTTDGPSPSLILGKSNKSLLVSERKNDKNMEKKNMKKKRWSSLLFLWIGLGSSIPVLVTNSALAAIVLAMANKNLHEVTVKSASSYIDFEKRALDIYVEHRSRLISILLEPPIRDLHIITRYTGWLLFNGVPRRINKDPNNNSNNQVSFIELISNVEECKDVPNVTECKGLVYKRVCDCDWDDQRGTCTNYASSLGIDARRARVSTRKLQKIFYVAQSHDTWPNGDRNASSYPEVDYSPESTSWYADVMSLPGSTNDNDATISTTYSRLRAVSSLPILQTLYNKDINSNIQSEHEKIHLSSYIGFEADGLLLGYEGCAYPGHANMSNYISSNENFKLRPNICPVGKYGYDPRCEEWYNTGKELYESTNAGLYVTSPYALAAESNHSGLSCTSPLTNTATREHMGQIRIDFLVSEVFSFLSANKTRLLDDGFPFLIAAENKNIPRSDNNSNRDTVIGPGFDFNHPKAIGDVVFGNDPNCVDSRNCASRQQFDEIVAKMKVGGNGTASFKRTTPDGRLQNISMAYYPIILNTFSPYDNADFSRGVKRSEYLIYSLALAEPEETLLEKFDSIEDELQGALYISLIILIIVICISSLFVLYMSYSMATSLTEPMHYLLGLIGQINDLDSYGNVPQVDVDYIGHSLEVSNVSKTLQSLYQVICSANIAFFAGDLEKAYAVLTDVLRLYRRLNNKKGVGIASNNLGNTMLAMYRTMVDTHEDCMCGFGKQEIIAKGIGYFHESITLGEKAYDKFYEEQGWSPSCLEFMQLLSNRYFNRAMFLLTVKNDHEEPTKVEELGFRDLQIVHDMDIEIVEEGTQAGWNVRTADRLFDVVLHRSRGHLLLLEMGYQDDWEVDEILEQGYKILRTELKNKRTSALFQDLSPVGRMQQIETEMMRYKMVKDDVLTAAKIAIRLLVEDEYTLLEAQEKAVEVLVRYANTPEFEELSSTPIKSRTELFEYHRFLLKKKELALLKLVQYEVDKEAEKTESRSEIITARSSLLKASVRGDYTMETF